MFKWFTRWYNKRRREIDKRILWPSLCEYASNEARARDGMLHHAFRDDAWNDLSMKEIIEEILELEYMPNIQKST